MKISIIFTQLLHTQKLRSLEHVCPSFEFLESRWASIAGPSSWSHVMCHRSWSGRARGAPRQLFAASKLFVAEAAASSGEKSRQQHIFVKCSSFDLLARCNFRSATEKQERAESSGFFGNPALCDGCSSLSPEYYKRHYKSSRNAVYLPHTMQYKVNES